MAEAVAGAVATVAGAIAVALAGSGPEQVPRNLEKEFVREREERHVGGVWCVVGRRVEWMLCPVEW